MLEIHGLRGNFYPSVTLQVRTSQDLKASRFKIQDSRLKIISSSQVSFAPKGDEGPYHPQINILNILSAYLKRFNGACVCHLSAA